MSILTALTHDETNRQKNTLNMIASENYPSPAVIDQLGGRDPSGVRSLWSNKYGEGYPGKRYYAGNQNTDILEKLVQEKALQIFDQTRLDLSADSFCFTNNSLAVAQSGQVLGVEKGEYGVNVQVLSGSPANMMVYLAILNYGDMVLTLNVANGGHISHLHPTSNWTKFFKYQNYDLKEISDGIFEIDFEDYCAKIVEFRPKLVIIGCSSYTRSIDNYKQMCEFAHSHGALVLADVAHINGLIAAGLHPTPFLSGDSGADFVSMTTHKTFRGPRGAMLFYKNEFADIINKTIFPGTSGGPHFHQMAAIGQACLEILGEQNYPDNLDFVDYSQKVLDDTKLLENSLVASGLSICNPTQNHICLLSLPGGVDSLETQKKLERIGVITNRNLIPFDTRSAWRPSGIRLGMAALTSRGISSSDIKLLAKIIADAVLNTQDEDKLKIQSDEIVGRLNWWY